MKTTIQETLYRSGQPHEQVPLQNGQRHGIVRTWHKNGRLASEERFANGLLHGVCRQWDEAGHLLGKYKMVRGTGVQRAWHENGQIQMEISTVRGEFCGRSRSWLADGTPLSDHIYLHGRLVSAQEYRNECTRDKTLPRLGRSTTKRAMVRVTERYIHQVFVSSLLEKKDQTEALAWLQSKNGRKDARSLGRFKRESDAAKYVQALNDAGAVEVIVPDIYANKAGDQFADCLLVQLPQIAAKRKAVRKVAAQLQKRKLGAVQPDADIGETHLYLSMS